MTAAHLEPLLVARGQDEAGAMLRKAERKLLTQALASQAHMLSHLPTRFGLTIGLCSFMHSVEANWKERQEFTHQHP